MSPIQFIKNSVRRHDKFSPWPVFYPFIMTSGEKALFKRKIAESSNYLDTIEKVDSLGLFTIKKDIDLVEVEADYLKYRYNPE